MKKLIFIFLLCLSTLAGFSGVTCVSNTAETTTPGSTYTNLIESTSLPIAGTKSYKSTGFSSGKSYILQSPAFNFGTDSRTFAGTCKYAISQTVGSGTYTIKWELINASTLTLVTKLNYDVTGTGSASGTLTYYNVGVDPYSSAVPGSVFYRVTVTTTNTSTSTSNFVKLDDVGLCGGALWSGGSSYYSSPSYTSALSDVYKDPTTLETFGKLDVTKSTQSTTYCTGTCDNSPTTTVNVQQYRQPIAGGDLEFLAVSSMSFTNQNATQMQTFSPSLILRDANYIYTYELIYPYGSSLSSTASPSLPSPIGYRYLLTTGDATPGDACSASPVQYVFTSSGSIASNGLTLYLEAQLITVFPGDAVSYYHYPFGSALGGSFKVSAAGVTSSKSNCL